MAFFGLCWLQRPNSNSLFRAPIHEGFALSIWFGYFERFLRTLKHSAYTNKPKSARKYLFDFNVDVQPFGWFLLTSQFLFSLARLSSLNSHNLRIWDNRSVKRVEEQSFHIQILILCKENLPTLAPSSLVRKSHHFSLKKEILQLYFSLSSRF